MSNEPSNITPPESGAGFSFSKLWRRFAKWCSEMRAYLASLVSAGSAEKLGAASKSPLKLLVALLALLIVLLAIYWILDKLFIYFLARSYVEQIAEALDLNKHLADAFVYLTFVALAFFSGMIIRFSKAKRLIGVLGIVGLLTAHSLILWWGTRHEIVSTKGEALKCYVITRDTVRYGERPGIDPQTGRKCRAVTPEIVERLREYEKGNRPKRVVESDPTFFDLGTGEPVIWYAKSASAGIEIFDLMGFHPDTGEELIPVTREVVEEWKHQKQQEARQAPQRIDPKKYAFFDPITGKQRVWYRRAENSDYEFYDREGFHPLTGERLAVVTREVIDGWRKHIAENAAQKCYIITRDAVRYGDHPGIDPATGRQCRLLTAEVLGRLHEYEKGNRPQKIESAEPVFFDLRTGEPIVWYYKNKSGDIEIFNLMGFHPETGEELVPVNKEVVELWKSQAEQHKKLVTRRAPQRVDPDKFTFFDPVTGKPRVWYWRSEKGEYEFYDNPGFQPRTGDQLTAISRETIDAWRKDVALNEKRLKEEQLEKERARQQALEDQRKRTEADKLAKAAEQAAIEKDKTVGILCDQQAANPHDPKKSPDVAGVPYDVLKFQYKDAVDVCGRAAEKYPNELRYQYQFARALEFDNLKRALQIHLKLARLQYSAAFDNAGGILIRQKKYADAVRQFKLGVRHGDTDSMISLADLIQKGYAEGDYVELYAQAARRGNEGAQNALEKIQMERVEQQRQKQNEAEQQRRALEMFGAIVRGIAR